MTARLEKTLEGAGYGGAGCVDDTDEGQAREIRKEGKERKGKERKERKRETKTDRKQ